MTEGEADKFMGVAMDGWPIYGPFDSNGEVITASMLDGCNGWYLNDDLNQYQYRMTLDSPYIMGCYTGSPLIYEAPNDQCIFTADYVDNGDEPSCVSDQGGNAQGFLILLNVLRPLFCALKAMHKEATPRAELAKGLKKGEKRKENSLELRLQEILKALEEN